MSLSFGKSKTKESAQQKATQDPWAPTVPYVTDLLKKAGSVASGTPGPTDKQSDAFAALEANAAAGNPYATDMDTLTKSLFSGGDGELERGYGDLERRLTPIADGTNQNFTDDPLLQDLLKSVGDDVAWRTNRMFAGAGRDNSGINQNATARGVASATAPILFDQLNKERARTDAAARDLYGARTGTTTTEAEMGKAGIDTSKSALEARDYGPNQILNLEEQMKKMPYEELSWLADLLFPAAGLGQQTSGTSSGTSSTTSMGGKANVGSALASLFGV